MSEVLEIRVHATSRADELGYRGQHTVSQALNEREKFRIVGGHIMLVSTVLPKKIQHLTGAPSRVTAMAITTCGRSPQLSLECPKSGAPDSAVSAA